MTARPMQTIISTCQVNQMRGSPFAIVVGMQDVANNFVCFVMAFATWTS